MKSSLSIVEATVGGEPRAPSDAHIVAEIFNVRTIQVTRALPDLSIFHRATSNTDEASVVGAKRARSPDDDHHTAAAVREIEHYEAIARAASGETRLRRVVEGLKIPTTVNKPFKIFYMTEYHSAQDWVADFNDTMVEQSWWPLADRQRALLIDKKECVVGWLAETATGKKPASKTAWRLPFSLAAGLLAQCAFSRGSFAAANTVDEKFLAQWEDGTVDFKKIYEEALKRLPRPRPGPPKPQPKNGAPNSGQNPPGHNPATAQPAHRRFGPGPGYRRHF
jgi:hypothetical protein